MGFSHVTSFLFVISGTRYGCHRWLDLVEGLHMHCLLQLAQPTRWSKLSSWLSTDITLVAASKTYWLDAYCVVFWFLQIRFYPRDCKLDNTFSQVVRVPSQIMLLNTFHDILIVLCVDCHIMLYKLERKNSQPSEYQPSAYPVQFLPVHGCGLLQPQ